jgi:hypothetical protein
MHQHPTSIVDAHDTVTLHLEPADGRLTAEPHEEHRLTIGAATAIHGDLESIHRLLRRAITEIVQHWTDPSHQPGEPTYPPADTPADPSTVDLWIRWMDSHRDPGGEPDIFTTEFHRTDPSFWNHLNDLLTAAFQPGDQADDAPLPCTATAIRLAVLADGRAIAVADTSTGMTIATRPLSRAELTPGVSGPPAAAEALTHLCTAASVASVPRRPRCDAPPPSTDTRTS